MLHARALLLLDQGDYAPGTWTIASAAEAPGTTARSLEKLKQRLVEAGLTEAVERKKREKPPREIKFDGKFEARLLTLACSAPPEGRSRWTVRLLAEKAVELNMAESVSAMTICTALKNMNLSLT
ncbi:MAG: helix-turn-helix domain-containing protein [Kiritimatiellales bacterium]